MKEGNTKRSSAVWVATSGGVLIAAALLALYTPWLRVCDVRRVVVAGNHHVAAADVAALSGITRNQAIFAVPLHSPARRIETHPWIREAVVKPIFPHTIRIEIEEREVVAWIAAQDGVPALVIGDGGVVLEEIDETPHAIELEGVLASDWAPGGHLLNDRIAAVLERLHRGICGLEVARLNVEDLRSIELFLENGPHVRLGSVEALSKTLDVLDALGEEIDLSSFERIDLRFGGEATLVPVRR